jgi:hypothetical protein
MIPASALRKLARLGLSDEQADAIADMLREVEEATDRAANAKIDAREEDRRSRSRGGNAERQRRFRERNGNNGVTQDDNALQPVIQRDEPEPYKDNHARAPVCSNGSSLRSEPVIENKQEKLKPTVLSKKSECLEILLECLSVETATDLISHRKAKKSPMTAGAAKGLVKAFRAFGDTESAARAMMAQGWTGFNPEWMTNQPRGSPSGGNKRGGWGALAEENFYRKQNDASEKGSSNQAVQLVPIAGGSRENPSGGDSGGLFGDATTILISNNFKRM